MCNLDQVSPKRAFGLDPVSSINIPHRAIQVMEPANGGLRPNALAPLPVATPPSERVPPDTIQDEEIEDTKLEIKGNDAWNNAFRDACNKRTPAERAALLQTSSISHLFSQLEKEHSEHSQICAFEKGAKILGGILNGLNFLLNLASPVANIEPCTSSALAIVRLVTTLGITICGAATEMETDISNMLKYLPCIQFCDEVHNGHYDSPVHTQLVLVYTNLLDFVFHARSMLQGKHIMMELAKSGFQSCLSNIVGNFIKSVQELKDRVLYETNAIMAKIDKDLMEREVEKLLGGSNEKEVHYHNEFRGRAASACEWIKKDTTFQDWLLPSPQPNVLAIYGPTGCGKTVLVAHVVDYLRTPNETAQAAPVVCSYFCKDDGETNKVNNVLRSLLRQILHSNELLPRRFYDWQKERQSKSQIAPTQSIRELRDFIISLVLSLHQSIYFIIDGVDELDEESHDDLKDFLTLLCAQPQAVRILISSRYQDIAVQIPMMTIEFPCEIDRDRIIVQYLVEHHMASKSEGVRSLLVREITEKTQGCAIWARMVVEYFRKLKTSNPDTIKKEIDCMPPPQELSKLYMRIMEKSVNGVLANKETLARGLDLMAASRRILTLGELSQAVSVDLSKGTKLKRLADLEDDAERLLALIRPFIVIKENLHHEIVDCDIRLVHQSLKETIIENPPMDWECTDKRLTKLTRPRQVELNGLMLRTCVAFLLLEEFGEEELQQRTCKYQGWMEEMMWTLTIESFPEETTDLTPSPEPNKKTIFDFFYAYAACYWTLHFQDAPRDLAPSLTELIEISRPGSLRLKNWLDRMRRPDWNVDLEKNFVYHGCNPLALIVWFGSETALNELLKLGLDAAGLDDEEIRTRTIRNTTRHAIEYEKFYVVSAFLRNPSTMPTLRGPDLFALMAAKWLPMSKSHEPAKEQSWTQLQNAIFVDFKDVVTENGSRILLNACKSGCLPMVKKLFEVAKENHLLRQRLLQPTDDEYGPVGWAAFHGHHETLKYLCEQDGIDGHLHHTDKYGDNIYHAIARHGNIEVFKVLIKYFPEGVHQTNGSTSPLQSLVNSGSESDSRIETVKLLLQECKVDIYAGDPFFMPLRCAVRQGWPRMARHLITIGNANPWDVVYVSDFGEPHLHESCIVPGALYMDKDREVLRTICELMPLSLSTYYLSPPEARNQTEGG
ncbi:hypothetical protein M433DRAFT_2704 [Acidomyces richmondensis BFW]|nr:MAG: hypothetical protein FE78DRAFT_28640 [Acidomyces sp. 'richmondensis']KYG47576.1 hypothetical protein M433DRAFT_2704 [Acidomyces richmondensis BFW]